MKRDISYGIIGFSPDDPGRVGIEIYNYLLMKAPNWFASFVVNDENIYDINELHLDNEFILSDIDDLAIGDLADYCRDNPIDCIFAHLTCENWSNQLDIMKPLIEAGVMPIYIIEPDIPPDAAKRINSLSRRMVIQGLSRNKSAADILKQTVWLAEALLAHTENKSKLQVVVMPPV